MGVWLFMRLPLLRMVKMTKLNEKTLDLIATLEVDALLEGLQDEEVRKNPAFLEKVRKFLQQNKLITQAETPGVSKIQQESNSIPVFDDIQ